MVFGKLYVSKGNPRGIPIIAVAKANNIELELIETTPGSTDEEYRKINKLGKIPTFVGSDGFILHETIAISIYITSQNEKTTLLGKTKQDYASILKWMSFVNQDISNCYASWLYPFFGIVAYNKKVYDEGVKKTLDYAQIFEDTLQNNTFLVGERLTLADIFTASILSLSFRYLFDKKWRAANPNTTRWYETVINQPIYSDVCEKHEFIEEPVKYQPPAKKDAKKESAPKTPAPSKKKAKEEEEDEDEAPAAPKVKHPLESLPKPTLALDEWKRQYSNNDTSDALKWFWENYKPEEYSLWKLDYKYNNELTQVFMSSNLIGGFFARLEASRKYIFGAASVYGVKDDSVIQGAFLIRGQDVQPAFEVAPDFESYEFTKLDHTKIEDKQFIDDQWTWEKPITINGKEYPWADGKVFK
ncbi:putative elongation factor 1 gamma domain-containing protein [Erysiphe necator]|uniref:Putative elongation factor 1 gamma domain-containing protein n=1 Tax=Uncinula necator TaxID=52586 RepID=A0A0B1P243_UNCNE|nr:putative elongation factor 1 gamma domain-containing protein [Erysiphe necator]